MDGWGKQLKLAELTIAEMIAIGLDLPVDSFSKTINNGVLALSPPGTDL